MLNTKDIKTGTGGTPKVLQPGNHKVTIRAIGYEDFKFKPGALHIVLNLEGEEQDGDFEGFFIDKNNESLGRYKGQVGKVKANEYAYADGVTKTGIEIGRDSEILKFLKNLCVEVGCDNWLIEQNGKHSTIQSLIEQFNNDAPFKDKWLNTCIAGKEYLNKEGYTSYDLFFPKYSKTGIPFESAVKNSGKVAKFNERDHIKKKPVENVAGFDGDGASSGSSVNNDFKL
jgi:hypothetical protein